MWVRYESPQRVAIIDDLQDHRQAGAPLSPSTVRSRYALFHCPAVIGVSDFQRRSQVLVRVLADAFTHSRLSDEQQVIARWMFMPSPEAPEQLVRERRHRAVEEMLSTLLDSRGHPVRMTARQVEDRESRVVGIVADLLLDPEFGAPHIAAAAQSGDPPVPPPADPYQGDGFEWYESTHETFLHPHDPQWRQDRHSIIIRALRRKQRFFTMLDDGPIDEDLGWELLGARNGQQMLPVIEERLPYIVKARLIIVYLGRPMQPGETQEIQLQHTFRGANVEQNLSVQKYEAASQRLTLRAHVPASRNCRGWTAEIWTPPGPAAANVLREHHAISHGTDVDAVLDVTGTRPGHLYRLVWNF